MQFSVVIPLFNKAPFIKRAVNSVLSQTFQDFELIIVNDGSTDGSDEIVKGIFDPRIRVIDQNNQGVAAARNRGASESRSNLISFLDADDEWFPEFLEYGNRIFILEPGVEAVIQDVCIKGIASVNLNNRIIGKFICSSSTDVNLLTSLLTSIKVGSIILKKDVFTSFGGFFDIYRCQYGEDEFLWLNILLNKKCYFLDSPGLVYHLEASELSAFSEKAHPIEPFLIYSDLFYENSNIEKWPLLHQFLNKRAYKTIMNNIVHNNVGAAIALYKRFKSQFTIIPRIFISSLFFLAPVLPNVYLEYKKILHIVNDK